MYREDSMAKLYKRNCILWIVGRCGCMVVGFTTTCAISLFVCLMVSVADLEGACGACAPLKFAKHMLYNVN